MKLLTTFLSTGIMALLYSGVTAQEAWPRSITAPDGTIIRVYQPQPESFRGNILTACAAISVQEPGMADPAFGAFWSTDQVATDRDNRLLTLKNVTVTGIRIPADSSSARLNYFTSILQSQLAGATGALPLDEVLSSLNQDMETAKLSNNISTQPPLILLTDHPAVLVTIDGAPRLQKNDQWKVDAIVNTPFTIVREDDGRFYLLGNDRWYTSPEATGPYVLLTTKPDRHLRKILRQYNRKNKDQETAPADTATPTIMVTTTPAELLQTDGAPDLAPIPGTALLYINNSPDNIFLDTQSQAYYVLLSGRWYTQGSLKAGNGWTFVAADKLPGDFAKIPEGSPKDNVLASVAGTDAAREAAMDAQIPQTAKIDRRSATTTVMYDGTPQFEPISGTSLQYAVNTSTTVLLDGNTYYALDNGVWFVSSQATGPWTVSTARPNGLDAIPPNSPVYNAKYVDIYDVDPNYVYMGYTPGYLNNFLFGPTVVYGTGFYYQPWIGSYYFPRPWSWGFDMLYNPWYGWGFGFDDGFGWLNLGFGFGWDGWWGGWWGPGFYYPGSWGHVPFGFYGRDWRERHGQDHNFVHAHNDLYRGRRGVVPHSGGPWANTRPRSHAVIGGSRIMADRQGNVFQRDEHGGWQARSGGRPNGAELNRQMHMQDRGTMRVNNFHGVQHVATPHFGGFHGGGGFHGAGGFHGGGIHR